MNVDERTKISESLDDLKMRRARKMEEIRRLHEASREVL